MLVLMRRKGEALSLEYKTKEIVIRVLAVDQILGEVILETKFEGVVRPQVRIDFDHWKEGLISDDG